MEPIRKLIAAAKTRSSLSCVKCGLSLNTSDPNVAVNDRARKNNGKAAELISRFMASCYLNL
jgi:hypothetical protein